METNFNFKSSVCTSREQSERLLALGLKKETADCMIITKSNYVKHKPKVVFDYDDVLANTSGFEVIPAWSLHRLIKLAYGNWDENIVPIYLGNSYDMLIGRIEFQIKQGKFNKDYLA